MKPLDADKKPAKPAETAPAAPVVEEKIDFSNVQIEPPCTRKTARKDCIC